MGPILKHLRREDKKIQAELEQIKKEDPFADTDRINDNADASTEVMEQEGHFRVEVIKREMQKTLIRIRKAMSKINLGKYGVCEHCNGMIDTDRLAIMPTAEFCVKCASKDREA